MDDDDTTEENTLLNSEDEREVVNFALEASRCLHSEDRERAEKRGESSTSRGTGSGHGSLAAHIGDASESGPTRSLQTHIEGPAGFPAKGSHRAQAEGLCQMKPHVAVLIRVPMPDQTPPGGNTTYMTDQPPVSIYIIYLTSFLHMYMPSYELTYRLWKLGLYRCATLCCVSTYYISTLSLSTYTYTLL
jgi:hypothetical protein